MNRVRKTCVGFTFCMRPCSVSLAGAWPGMGTLKSIPSASTRGNTCLRASAAVLALGFPPSLQSSRLYSHCLTGLLYETLDESILTESVDGELHAVHIWYSSNWM